MQNQKASMDYSTMMLMHCLSQPSLPQPQESTVTIPGSSQDVAISPRSAQAIAQQYNGWCVPLGVHKVICATPGLRVSTGVHRGSMAVKIPGQKVATELIIPPGTYVEILETQIHGERVRGRICWEIEIDTDEDDANDTPTEEKVKEKKSLKSHTSRILKRKNKKSSSNIDESEESRTTKLVTCEGWISIQWARSEEEEGNEDEIQSKEIRGETCTGSRVTDEDAGPWVSYR